MLTKLYRAYAELWQTGDPRVSDWPLMQTPSPTIAICLLYVIGVKYVGPRYMRDRKPFEIRTLMLVYNFAMVLASIYLFYKIGYHGWFGKYNFACQPVDYSSNADAIGMASISWWYYVSKFVEFLDTIFFVMRKKMGHISTLHVIHHGIMPMSVWWGVRFTPGGHSTFFAFLNSFVHILMYTYYAIAAIGPHMHKYLWWKRYMTGVQMVQFVLIFVHSFQLLFRDCQYPRGFMWWIGFHAVMFWFLFWNFYKSEYQAPKRRATKMTSIPKLTSASSTNEMAKSASRTTTTTSSSTTNTTGAYQRIKTKSEKTNNGNKSTPSNGQIRPLRMLKPLLV